MKLNVLKTGRAFRSRLSWKISFGIRNDKAFVPAGDIPHGGICRYDPHLCLAPCVDFIKAVFDFLGGGRAEKCGGVLGAMPI